MTFTSCGGCSRCGTGTGFADAVRGSLTITDRSQRQHPAARPTDGGIIGHRRRRAKSAFRINLPPFVTPPLPLRCMRCIVTPSTAGITGQRQVIEPSISAAPEAIWPGCTTIPAVATRACAGATADSAGSNSRILRAATYCRPALIHTRCRAIIPLFTRMKLMPHTGRLNMPARMTRVACCAGLTRIHPPVLALTARKGAGTNRHRNPNRRAPQSQPLRRRPRRNLPRRPNNRLSRSSPPKRLNPSPPNNQPKPEHGVGADGVGG